MLWVSLLSLLLMMIATIMSAMYEELWWRWKSKVGVSYDQTQCTPYFASSRAPPAAAHPENMPLTPLPLMIGFSRSPFRSQ